MKKIVGYTLLALTLLAALIGFGLSALNMMKANWVKNELARRALIELEEKQNRARIKVAEDAITILEGKVRLIQDKGGASLCPLILSWQNVTNLHPEVLRYKINLCAGYPYNRDAIDIANQAMNGIRAITPLEYIMEQSPKGSKDEWMNEYRKPRSPDSSATKEVTRICDELEARLQSIAEMTPSLPNPAPPPAEKPASK